VSSNPDEKELINELAKSFDNMSSSMEQYLKIIYESDKKYYSHPEVKSASDRFVRAFKKIEKTFPKEDMASSYYRKKGLL
jgi:hypothetical protein